MFNRNSALAQIWYRNVINGTVTREQVPELSNLRDIVYELLNETPE